MALQNSKIIQIFQVSKNNDDYSFIALCDNGKLFEYSKHNGWKQLPELPSSNESISEEKNTIEKWNSITIEELYMTVRTTNCLKAEGIKTIYDLIQWSEINLLKIPNFGRKSLREIVDALASQGLSLNTRV